MRLFSFLWILFAALGNAADAPARTCRILFLHGPDDAPQTLFLFDGAQCQEVELPRMNFSPVYRLHPATTAVALLPNSIDPTTKPPLPGGTPTATIAEHVTDCYLLLTHDPSNKVAPVKIQVIDANATQFPRGHMLWFNLTPHQIIGEVGSAKLAMRPQSRRTIDAPARGQEDYHVHIRFVPPGQSHPEPLCQTNWTHDPRSRTVVFLYQPPASVTPRIFAFPDFR